MSQQLSSVLRGWDAIDVKGPDAKDFLQRLTSADFRKLFPGRFTPATLLQPTGKIVSYFKALCLAQGEYVLLSPSPGTAEALEKMHFRENLSIAPRAGTWFYTRALSSTKPSEAPELEPGHCAVVGDAIWFNEDRWAKASGLAFDYGVLSPSPLKLSGFTEVADLELYRVRAGDPAAPNELGPTTMPLEAALDDAVHENKGCYPGQEVIERIRAMGQVPRVLRRVSGAGAAPALPTKIVDGSGAEAGVLTSAVSESGGRWLGLGFVKRVFLKPEATFSAGGNPIQIGES